MMFVSFRKKGFHFALYVLHIGFTRNDYSEGVAKCEARLSVKYFKHIFAVKVSL